MTLFESGLSCGSVSFRELCAGEFSSAKCRRVPLGKVADAVTRGGWPVNVGEGGRNKRLIRNYVNGVILKISKVGGVDYANLIDLTGSLAKNESRPVSNRALINHIVSNGGSKLAKKTVKKYLHLLQRFHVIDHVDPTKLKLRSSVDAFKRRKMRFFDPSIACSLLKADNPQTLFGDHITFGLMFESMCIRDLKAYAQTFGSDLRYYQDSWGNEIDAIIINHDNTWAAFEIKLSEDAVDETAQKLSAFVKGIPKEAPKPKVMGIIVASGEIAYKRKQDGVYVTPITALRP